MQGEDKCEGHCLGGSFWWLAKGKTMRSMMMMTGKTELRILSYNYNRAESSIKLIKHCYDTITSHRQLSNFTSSHHLSAPSHIIVLFVHVCFSSAHLSTAKHIISLVVYSACSPDPPYAPDFCSLNSHFHKNSEILTTELAQDELRALCSSPFHKAWIKQAEKE